MNDLQRGMHTAFATHTAEVQAIGFYFYGSPDEQKGMLNEFFKVRCPCGVEDTRAINDFPTITTPHKCGKPNHWFVKYQEPA